MKKIIIFVFIAAAIAAFSQQAPEGGRQPGRSGRDGRSGRMDPSQLSPEMIEKMKEWRAEQEKKVEEPAAEVQDASAENQENFEEIMGSFSELAMKFSKEDSEELDVFVYECQHVSAEAFARALEPFLSVHGELSDCEDSDLVVISDEKERLERLKGIAESIDRPIRQVLVSASVVGFQITDTFEKDISLQYNQFRNLNELAPDDTADVAGRILDTVLPSGGNPKTLSGESAYVYYDPEEQAIFSSFIKFLDTEGTAQILSSPSLIMRRGHTGNIVSGEDIPITKSTQNSAGTNYSVDYKSVGIKLRVTPQSIFDDRVVLEVSPEVSNIIRYEVSAAGRNPVIAIRSASTKLEIYNGQMVSIGGLLREEQIEVKRKVPILGDLPLLGALFRANSREDVRSQLVIFLSAQVVDPADLTMDTVTPIEVSEEMEKRLETYRKLFLPEEGSLLDGIDQLYD